ncbi:MAG: hypothetical protein JSV97_07075 [candidate division WOR-3 bacterium]|nr:MAG: hypothetical protein JSV97_07075 [candidate division WOR-3 bacterium]
MKAHYCIFVITAFFLSCVHCGAPSEPKEYIHTRAGFKITAPAGWKKKSEDFEMFEFRSGDYKLVEVGGFALGIPPDDFYRLTDDDFFALLRESTREGLDSYCTEATIRDYTISDSRETVWGDRIAYRAQAKGYSNETMASMVVDIIAIVYEEKSRVYMFASQIDEKAYAQTKKYLELMIASFQIIE